MACVYRCLLKPEGIVSSPKLELQMAVSLGHELRSFGRAVLLTTALVPENNSIYFMKSKVMVPRAMDHRRGAQWRSPTLAERETLPVLGASSSGRPRLSSG